MKPFLTKSLFLFPFLFLFYLSFAQVKTYDAQWKKVEDLIQNKRLPQSALTEVKKIYAQAKKEKQEAQVIKSLLYISELQAEVREEYEPVNVKEFEKELATATEPSASILRSILANMYWQYFQNNRWNLYNRTNTVNFNKADIATWTADDFHKKISELYLQSINRNPSLLKATALNKFDAIILKGNVRYLRPTLYDLLTHEALEYFKTDESTLSRPSYAFEINDEKAFLPAADFIRQKFPARDSLSLLQKALLLYQDLIAFHLNDAKKEALLDVDIARLDFVHDHAVTDNKDSLYLSSLRSLVRQYNNSPQVNMAGYLIALWMDEKASGYSPNGDTSKRWLRVEAYQIVQKIVRDSSVKNEGWVNAYHLLQHITNKTFSFQVEKVNVPGQPFRSLVSYRNTGKLYFRIVSAEGMDLNLYEDPSIQMVFAEKPLAVWEQDLPPTNDYQEHAVEIKIRELPVGKYILLASTDRNFNTKLAHAGAQFFYVSNISYLQQGSKLFFLHRETGEPLPQVQVSVYKNEYDYSRSRQKRIRRGTYTTDNNGFLQLKLTEDERYQGYEFDIRNGKDSLNLDEAINFGYYDYYGENEKPGTKKIVFFTDRSIYRPGQTVYFKGIVVQSGANDKTIAINYRTTLYLRNANYEVTDSLTLTTNEYGSFSGTFKLPQGGLTGRFRIVEKDNRNQSDDFSVEEYKRPKFAVSFEKLKEAYKVNDTIRLTGVAKAYAGNNVDGAKVSYRVMRRPRFIYTWRFSKMWMPPADPMEIVHGETKTDKNGKFIISFPAIPDKSIDTSYNPVFDYVVMADVTDINGETRTGEESITAGYRSLQLSVQIPERIPVDSITRLLKIRTLNLNQVFQPASVQVIFYKQEPEQRLIRSRYWTTPDQFVMTKEEYIRFFPHDEYKDENNPQTWAKTERFRMNGTTVENGTFNLDSDKPLPAGYYQVVVITHDKEGREIKDQVFTELVDPSSTSFNRPEYLWARGTGKAIEPGETTSLQIGSSTKVHVIHQVDKQKGGNPTPIPFDRKNGQPIPAIEVNEDESGYRFLKLDNEKKNFLFTAREEDRGGYGVIYFYVKDNRFYFWGDVVRVPWTNKELQVEFSTFRDKTLPGSQEKWTVKISGNKKEKVAAEMLAGMYDASLDQFRPHQWNKPSLFPNYAYLPRWAGQTNFAEVQSYEKYISQEERTFTKEYDLLMKGIYGHIGYYGRNSNYMLPERARAAAPPMAGREGAALKSIKVAAGEKEETIQIRGKNSLQYQTIIDASSVKQKEDDSKQDKDDPIQVRKNFNETAFFFPELRTDSSGAVTFTFTTPEALTRWKIQALAHTKDLAFGRAQTEMVTQKELMVQPNTPRFVRQGDHMELSAKIVNLTGGELTGQAALQLFDATTNQSVDGYFINSFPNQYFTVAAGQSEVVKFPIQVPFQFDKALTWRIVARTDKHSDGEEDALPVLSNKILVTETLPIAMRGASQKEFNFKKLSENKSETLQTRSLTVEYTSNPAWYVVQALPYLMEYPYECAEQIWNRYYANALASHIANSSPRIREIFERWRTTDTSALISNLEKNPELKSALLAETPWVLDGKNETEQKKNIARLFELEKIADELQANAEKLRGMQTSSGAFPWFKGGSNDRYITQYVLTGMGHLKKSGVDIKAMESIITRALPYLDHLIKEDYDQLVKRKADLSKQQVSSLQINYLYMRSFFPEYKLPESSAKAYAFFLKQSGDFWTRQSKYLQGMTALVLYRKGQTKIPGDILRSLKETSVNSEEMGRYWKEVGFGRGFYWYHAPIETQSLMVEVFTEVGKDHETADELRTWLVKNKQTNNWNTTRATADACYAFILRGTNWLTNEPKVSIQVGNRTLDNSKGEAGTGYFKEKIEGETVRPEMGTISVSVIQPPVPSGTTANAPSWGAVYWQYFEDMDKVTSAATPLQLSKKLFVEKNTDRGPVLDPVTESTELKVGDKIKVRIELRVDRDMEYVHMKDLRASALEPVNVLSSYKYQGGLGYYESTRDASTNFFFSYLRKGTYVFEYPLFVTHTGSFSNGITTIQCMYAPEFSAHSEGVRIRVE